MGSYFTRSQQAPLEEDSDKIQVNQWDNSAVKNAIDDVSKDIASEKLKFEEVFHLMNARLAISCLAVFLALIALVYDYLEPFPKSKHVLATCSVSYFLMMGVFTLFTLVKEKNIVYQGDDMETVVGVPARLEFSTSLKKYHNIFQFSISLRNGKISKDTEFEFPIEEYFTEDGVLLKDKFEKLLLDNFAKISHVRKGESKKAK